MITLERSIIEGLTHDHPTPAVLRGALQRALELEHATIPLYLYALYSLMPERNRDVARVLESVVVEEMLHMALVSNLLNALGGEAVLASPAFVPRYPGRLPGGIEQHLTVHLAPFSLEQLEVFIEIEEPREPINHESLLNPQVEEPCTIGEFYELIKRALARIDATTFVAPARNQVGPELMYGAVVVDSAASAVAAIDVIIAQGEGSSMSPEEVAGFGGVNDVAHFYRFVEIQRGRRLVRPDPSALTVGFDYVGDPITFDPEGVYEVPTDPTREEYLPGSRARYLVDTFNFTYTSLLHQLDRLFNGHADADAFARAIGVMKSLHAQARTMASDESPLGATFEYQAEAPGPPH